MTTVKMKPGEKRDLIIIDPMLISKDEDWGDTEDSIFNWSLYQVNSPLFSEYFWGDVNPCGFWGLGIRFTKNLGKQMMKDEILEILDLLDADNEGALNEKDFEYLEGSVNSNENSSGSTGVFYLDEVLKYNPDFKIPEEDCIIIKDYLGTVEFDSSNDYIIGFGKNKKESFAII